MELQTLTIFYTYQLGGDLTRLPRLYRYLQTLKQEYDPRALLLDLGGSCRDDVWHCAATGGRSTLIVLDGMGYHAANVSGFLAEGEYDRLKNVTGTGLVDEQHTWRYHIPPVKDEGIIVAGAEVPALTLCIVAAPAEETMLRNRSLFLKAVAADEIGIVQLDLEGTLTITLSDLVTMPPDIKPDASIAASVEFVEDEARFYQQRRNN